MLCDDRQHSEAHLMCGKRKAAEFESSDTPSTADDLRGKGKQRLIETELSREDDERDVGFMDGDGMIQRHYRQIRVQIAESSRLGEPELLKAVQMRFGGVIMKLSDGKTEDQRPQYCLRIHENSKHHPFLDAIAQHGIVKEPQAREALCFLSGDTASRLRQEACDRRLQELKSEYKLIPVDPTKLTPAYRAGLFEAEGCCRIHDGSIYIDWAQEGSLDLLKALSNVYGSLYGLKGIVRGGNFRIQGDKTAPVIQELRKWVRGTKLLQLDIIDEHLKRQKEPGLMMVKLADRMRRLRNMKQDLPPETQWLDRPQKMSKQELYVLLKGMRLPAKTRDSKETLLVRFLEALGNITTEEEVTSTKS